MLQILGTAKQTQVEGCTDDSFTLSSENIPPYMIVIRKIHQFVAQPATIMQQYTSHPVCHVSHEAKLLEFRSSYLETGLKGGNAGIDVKLPHPNVST